jgi:iron complex transport system substrate-binding protein
VHSGRRASAVVQRALAPFAVCLALVALATCDRSREAHEGGGASAGGAAPRAARATLAATDTGRKIIDDFGSPVSLGLRPQRIVSLNPTTTELLFALGEGARLVGRTHWDVWPDASRRVPDLGAGIRPNVEAVLAAHPDLVILYASADNRAAANAFLRAHIPVFAFKVDRIADFMHVTRALGRVLGDSARAALIADSVEQSLEQVRRATSDLPHPTAFWLMWPQPLMTVGRGSFLSELLDVAGARNVYADLGEASPQIAWEDLLRRDPSIVIVTPPDSGVLRSDARWRGLRAVREGRVFAVDTTLVMRPGVRLGEAAWSLARLLHPELATAAAPRPVAP